jgi:hypothetical protein
VTGPVIVARYPFVLYEYVVVSFFAFVTVRTRPAAL